MISHLALEIYFLKRRNHPIQMRVLNWKPEESKHIGCGMYFHNWLVWDQVKTQYDPSDKEKLLKLGARLFITKTSNLKKLKNKLKEVLTDP